MRVTFINRHAGEGCFSFEELFENIKRSFPKDVLYKDFFPGPSRSLAGNILAAMRLEGDVFHITGGVNYLGIFLDGKKTVLTVHDIGHYTDTLKGIKRAIYGLLWFALPLRRVAYVTTVSKETKEALLRHFRIASGKVRVIPNCYPVDYRFNPNSFNGARPRILQIGTKFYKNIDRLIEAVKGLSCKLVLVGMLSPETAEKLREYEVDYENLFNLSHDEVHEQYILCDMVTFASIGEGFGLPIIEANAVGRPVVTSNVSSMPEVAGDAACLVDPLSVESIRRGIERVIRDREYRETLVRNGLENIKRFSPERIAGMYLEVYEELRH